MSAATAQADTPATAPPAALPPLREHFHMKRSAELKVGALVLDVNASSYGTNGPGSTLICEPEVSLRLTSRPMFGFRVELPDLTPTQARQLAGYLLDAAAFAEGGDAPDSGALRTAVASLALALRELRRLRRELGDDTPEEGSVIEASRAALDKLAAVMAPGREGFKS